MHYARRCTNFKVIGKRFYEIKLLFSNLIPDREINEVACRATSKPYQGTLWSPRCFLWKSQEKHCSFSHLGLVRGKDILMDI